MRVKDPYIILGVARTASADEVKRAYRRLVKEFHPDHNRGDKGAEHRFKEIQAAYEVLGDPKRRSQYDAFGAGGPTPEFRDWRAPPRQPRTQDFSQETTFDFGNLGDLSSIFEQFFRRTTPPGARRTGQRGSEPATQSSSGSMRGGNLEYPIELSFEEAAAGAKRQVVLGPVYSDGDERLEVTIPPGVDEGQLIRVRGKGQPGPSGPGDLMIRCHIRPHQYFRREGRDILLDLPLSVSEAVLGARVDIPTLDGAMRLTVPPGATSGTKLRLRGKGIADPRGGEPGDMYAVVQVGLPRPVPAKLKELIESSADDWAIDARKHWSLG